MRLVQLILATGCLLLPGCAGIEDYRYSLVNEYRAYRAWAGTTGKHDVPYHKDFGAGWRQGYFDVCTGRCGQVPVIPPKAYWSPCQQNERGAAKLESWYQGYQQGAIAADEDGFGNWHRLPARGLAGPPPPDMPLDGMPPDGSSVDASNVTDAPLTDPTPPPATAEPATSEPAPSNGPATPPTPEEMPAPQSSRATRHWRPVKPASTVTERPTVPAVVPHVLRESGPETDAAPNASGPEDGDDGEARVERLPPVVPVNYTGADQQPGGAR